MNSLYQTVTDTIVAALNRGVVPWRKPWNTTALLPVNAITNRAYRGVNILLLSLAPYTDPRWITLRQVKEKGGRVEQGERSTLIVFWKRAEDEVDPDGQKVRRPPILRYYHAFNVEQCEGLGLAEPHRPSESDHEPIERAELLIQGMPNPPRIVEGKSAWYRPSDDLVNIPPLKSFESPCSYYQTLIHELAHSTGHVDRLNRTGVTGDHRFGSGEYSKEELVAELASAFCCAVIGLDNSLIEDSATYINGWLKVLKSDKKALVVAAAQAQRAADYIQGLNYR